MHKANSFKLNYACFFSVMLEVALKKCLLEFASWTPNFPISKKQKSLNAPSCGIPVTAAEAVDREFLYIVFFPAPPGASGERPGAPNPVKIMTFY